MMMGNRILQSLEAMTNSAYEFLPRRHNKEFGNVDVAIFINDEDFEYSNSDVLRPDGVYCVRLSRLYILRFS